MASTQLGTQAIKFDIIMRFNIKHKIKTTLGLGRNPDFMVIGAAKCGTTSLMQYMEKYASNYSPPVVKEPCYFTEYNHLPLNHYRANFNGFNKRITGEGTPDYLYYPLAPKLIKEYNQVTKFVVILRDPVKRAFSQYMFQNYINKSEISDPMSFSKAIRQLDKRFFVDVNTRFYSEYKHFSYIQRGYYYDQLKRWYSYFSPDQFHVMFLEELSDNFSLEMQKLFTFLGLKHNKVPFKQQVYNKSSHAGLPQLQPEDATFLGDVFRESNAMLFELLKKDSIW